MTDDPLYDLLFVCHSLIDDPKSSEDYSDSMVSRMPSLIPPGVQYVRSNGGKHMPPYEGWRLEGFLITTQNIKRLFVGHWVMLLRMASAPIPDEITMGSLAEAVLARKVQHA